MKQAAQLSHSGNTGGNISLVGNVPKNKCDQMFAKITWK